ncbi:DUF7095 family protein [Halarchaeum nitratireducens]|uniref:Uncharacterized protein n=1 Tax=Halarchaeum nitratireducens TaxID=489913 RepID=A0A830GAN2_9EURY|nr:MULTISPECIES: hypothetical protein [Halarchaeum]MBP2250426.1 hypothetical protein [Halarchaeum solikamskense]GGN13522.1 hypothetical protein GCM10009021_12040 [Halarchaeum nitratireducens]
MDRDAALDRVEAVLDAVSDGDLPVPVTECWVYGEVALGKDPLTRLDVYVTKDLLLGGEPAPDLDAEYGVEGIGRTVDAEWAREHPEWVRTDDSGYVAPERCLAAQLLPEGEPVHLEVCNTGFERNVTQRADGARESGRYEQVIDPRGVCLYAEGRRDDETLDELRAGALAFPTLEDALGMLGFDGDEAATAAEAMRAYEAQRDGATVRGDVV